MSSQPIAIIGAGIGGVTLGRALKKRGIAAVLYERVSSSPRHSYGITLHAAAYRPLLKILDMDERTFRKRVAVDGALGGNGAIDANKLVHPGEVGSSSFRAHREKLERLLREGLDVRWEHSLEELEETSTGVTLCLQDGRKIEHTCVIGVDGVHANSRKSLLPEVEFGILPFVAFNGKRSVKRDMFQELYAPVMKDSTVVEVRRNGAILHISINGERGDSISINWIYSRAARGSNDSLYTPNRPASGATDIPDEFYKEIGSLRNLDQPFKDVFDEEKLRRERILSWLMRTVEVDLPDLRRLAKKGIYFMGDSVHAQPILGGEGANAAILDGLSLAEQIAAHGSQSIIDWYNIRFPDWKECVERSKRVNGEMHAGRTSVL